MREFNQPELTGPSGEPIEVPDSLAARILGFALEDRDSFALMEQRLESIHLHALWSELAREGFIRYARSRYET